MYAYMKGKITDYFEQGVILEVGNIGYNIYMSDFELNKLDKNDLVKIYTYYDHKEDYTRLFGFSDKNRLNFFKKLISVNGVGSKMGMAIMGTQEVEQLVAAIAKDDINTIKKAPGVGQKLAAKIIIELKDKIDISDVCVKKVSVKNKDFDEAIVALKVLGYTDKEIEECAEYIEFDGKDVQAIIKDFLKCLSMKK